MAPRLKEGTDEGDILSGYNSPWAYFQDLIFGYDGNDTIFGGRGRDTLIGGDDNDTLFGGTENDRLYGGQDRDTLYGGDGYDRLYGGSHNDILVGGEGRDTLYGGAGRDTANYATSDGQVFVRLDRGQGFFNEAQGDTYNSIENVTGSNYNDVIFEIGRASCRERV